MIASYAYNEQTSVNTTTCRTIVVLFNVKPHPYDAEVMTVMSRRHADVALSHMLHGLLSMPVVNQADIKA